MNFLPFESMACDMWHFHFENGCMHYCRSEVGIYGMLGFGTVVHS